MDFGRQGGLKKRLPTRARGGSLLSSLILAACLCACATGGEPVPAEADLSAVAEGYWTKRLLARDYRFTYALEFEKDKMDFESYVAKVRAGEKFKYSSVKVEGLKLEGSKGIVTVLTRVRGLVGAKEVGMPIQDVWIFESGGWRHQFGSD